MKDNIHIPMLSFIVFIHYPLDKSAIFKYFHGFKGVSMTTRIERLCDTSTGNKIIEIALPTVLMVVSTLAFLAIALFHIEYTWDIELPIFYWSHRVFSSDIALLVMDGALLAIFMLVLRACSHNAKIGVVPLKVVQFLYVAVLVLNVVYRILLDQILNYGLVLFN